MDIYKNIGNLFDVERQTIAYHIKEIYESEELQEISTFRKFRQVQNEGSRNVTREIDFIIWIL